MNILTLEVFTFEELHYLYHMTKPVLYCFQQLMTKHFVLKDGAQFTVYC